MPYILQTDHVSKTIGDKVLLDEVSIHVKKGEIYGFLGPNGAGKTSLLKVVTNLWKPTSGSVEIFGNTLTIGSYEPLKRIGSIIEFPSFYDHLSGEDNLKLHCEYMGYHHKEDIARTLKLVHLESAGDKPAKNYSLGMRQRLGIARAILCRPELLILDEPTNGLDPAGMKQVRDILSMLCSEYQMSIIVSSHILSEIESIAQTIGIIHHGKLIEEIAMKEIVEKNGAYIELTVSNTQKAAYVLTEKMSLSNFKVVDSRTIRIYSANAAITDISKAMLTNDIEILEIKKVSEDLEDYFLKMTGEVE